MEWERIKVRVMDKNLTNFARKLRRKSTNAEAYLWRYLRNRQLEGLKFRRQQPIGKYIVDFVNFENKIIIEVDGGQHNVYKERDKIRDEWLNKQGFQVLRFWNNDILRNIEGVLEVIKGKILSPHPNPLPHRGEGSISSPLTGED